MESTRILLADDHTLFRKGFRTILEQMPELEVVGEAASGHEVVTQAQDLVPDAILMDIKMPGISLIEATSKSSKKTLISGSSWLPCLTTPSRYFQECGQELGATCSKRPSRRSFGSP